MVRPNASADLQAFLDRYRGTVIAHNTVPQPSPELRITLTDEERKPTEYLVRITLAGIDVSHFAEDSAALGAVGRLELSSQEGLQTLAAVADSKLAGFRSSANYVEYATQLTFPTPLFGSQDRPSAVIGGGTPVPPGAAFADPFLTQQFQTQSNLTLAWQFVAAHGVQRRARVAIIDSGFWLNPNGTLRGPETDWALPVGGGNIAQWDFISMDNFADGPSAMSCTAATPCAWHGTGSASTAAAVLNNQSADAGTGGLIADLALYKIGGSRFERNSAIRTSHYWRADVVSMSFGGDCNVWCRINDRDNPTFDDWVDAGSLMVFIAAAGNGAGNPLVGYDVGDPRFVHPCIEDHVICVGALNNGASTATSFSNFGGAVDIFAPTNIPVLAQPGPNDPNATGPITPILFGGTSASTPFVAGVVAMMKAINPNLNTDAVATILRDSSRAGIAPATRILDAYAAVRRAAEGIDGVKDRLEVGPAGNDLDSTPTLRPGPGPFNEPNLNLDTARDRDYFQFDPTGASTATIDVQYPEALGIIPVTMQTQGDCGQGAFVSDSALPGPTGRGRRIVYTLPGGSSLLRVGGGLINAYNLTVSFAGAAVAADRYEPNNTVATAKRLFSLTSAGAGLSSYIQRNPRVTIDASIHAAADLDYYVVRGATLTGPERFLMSGFPAVKVYGNESSISMEVRLLNPDGTQGALVTPALTSGSCSKQPLVVPLTADVNYLVKVSGAPGRYVLRNGVDGDRRRFPVLVRDRVYEVLNPGEPVERALRFPEQVYVFAADRTFSQIQATGQRVHLQLFDFEGNLIAEGTPGDQGIGERLSLASTVPGQVYALKILPQEFGEKMEPMRLNWTAMAKRPR